MRQYEFGKASNSSTLWNSATPDSKEHERVLSSKQPAPAARLRKSTSGIARQSSLLQLQREQGNRYVQRVLALARSAEGDGNVMPDVERAIESSRGGGQSLDSGVKAQMGSALNADFSGVRVHTDAGADGLNQSLSAKAFTTGSDIYFRQGEYNPGSSGGRELLAHELTHVVQQNPDKVQTKPDDEGISDKLWLRRHRGRTADETFSERAGRSIRTGSRPDRQRGDASRIPKQCRLVPGAGDKSADAGGRERQAAGQISR